MTPDDLDQLERELEITLPASYRRALVPFPVAAAAGNSDLAVWDDPKKLTELNRELRQGAAGRVKPWPAHLFAVGHPGDGCPYAIDVRGGDEVWWVDHCHLENPGTTRERLPFAAWAADYFRVLRDEMVGEEVDPDGTPGQRAAVESKQSRLQALSCLMVALVVGLVASVAMWMLR